MILKTKFFKVSSWVSLAPLLMKDESCQCPACQQSHTSQLNFTAHYNDVTLNNSFSCSKDLTFPDKASFSLINSLIFSCKLVMYLSFSSNIFRIDSFSYKYQELAFFPFYMFGHIKFSSFQFFHIDCNSSVRMHEWKQAVDRKFLLSLLPINMNSTDNSEDSLNATKHANFVPESRK